MVFLFFLWVLGVENADAYDLKRVDEIIKFEESVLILNYGHQWKTFWWNKSLFQEDADPEHDLED